MLPLRLATSSLSNRCHCDLPRHHRPCHVTIFNSASSPSSTCVVVTADDAIRLRCLNGSLTESPVLIALRRSIGVASITMKHCHRSCEASLSYEEAILCACVFCPVRLSYKAALPYRRDMQSSAARVSRTLWSYSRYPPSDLSNSSNYESCNQNPFQSNITYVYVLFP